MFQRVLRAFIASMAGGFAATFLNMGVRLVLMAMQVDARAFTNTITAVMVASATTLAGVAVSGYVLVRMKPADWRVPALLLAASFAVVAIVGVVGEPGPFWPIRLAYPVLALAVLWLVGGAASRRAEQALQPDASPSVENARE